jgi:hypothetical protein
MNRPADTVLSRPLAREVCQWVGAKALLAGMLVSMGPHYTIGLEGIDCLSGETLVRQQVEVPNREGVLGGLGQAVSSLRRRLGESAADGTTPKQPVAGSSGIPENANGAGRTAECATSSRNPCAAAHRRLGAMWLRTRGHDGREQHDARSW